MRAGRGDRQGGGRRWVTAAVGIPSLAPLCYLTTAAVNETKTFPVAALSKKAQRL